VSGGITTSPWVYQCVDKNAFNAPSAITNLSAATLVTDGLSTIDDVLAIQITCG
jgi:hypothetical protein